MTAGHELEGQEAGAAAGVERVERRSAGEDEVEDTVPGGTLGGGADAVAEVLVEVLATFVGFIGLAVPNFLLALVLLYLGFVLFNAHIGGLFSPELQDAPWSTARVWDLLTHLPIPALILGLAGTAQQIRIMRANLLDELRKPYVVTAR